MDDFNHLILLVNLDKDYISAAEQKEERSILKSGNLNLVRDMGYNLFDQALNNLRIDVEMWKATSGVDMALTVKSVLVHDEDNDNYYKTRRTYTRVYGTLTKADDLAWFKLQFGDFKPSTKLVHYQSRGWQFEWA